MDNEYNGLRGGVILRIRCGGTNTMGPERIRWAAPIAGMLRPYRATIVKVKYSLFNVNC